MTQLTLPFATTDEDTATEIRRLTRALLTQIAYTEVRRPFNRADYGFERVELTTPLGTTHLVISWETSHEWLEHYRDIFADYQCCAHMEQHENNHGEVTSEDYLILDVSVTAYHAEPYQPADEIGRASVGGVALGWTEHHGGPDRLYLAQVVRDLAADAL